MSIDCSYSSPELSLLALYVEADAELSAAHNQAKQQARADQRAAMQAELEALEEKADATRLGAFVSGGASIASGALSFNAEATKAPYVGGPSPEVANTPEAAKAFAIEAAHAQQEAALYEKSARLVSDLGKPASDLVGTARKEAADRDARAAAQAQEQAKWRADDASDAAKKQDAFTDRMLEHMQRIIETQNATTVAVLSNF